MGEWLSMETAPRNEDDVLLWVGRVEIGYFSSVSGRWLSRDERHIYERPKRLEPTYWMPLPTAPAAKMEAA
jgi:hypothetical protein